MISKFLSGAALAGCLLVGAANTASAGENEALAAWKAQCGKMVSQTMNYPRAIVPLPDDHNVVEAVIDRSGRVFEARLVEKGNRQIFDRASEAFARKLRSLPPLPDDFAAERAVVRMHLVYADNERQAAGLTQKVLAAAATETTRTVEIEGVKFAGVPVIDLLGGS